MKTRNIKAKRLKNTSICPLLICEIITCIINWMVAVTKTRRKSLSAKATGPRIVILDNDETTGSYGPLFHLLDLLSQHGPGLHAAGVRLRDLVPALGLFCLEAQLFRPGLRDLLLSLRALRMKGRLDSVVMYTYQSEPALRSHEALYDAVGQFISVPILIDYMFGWLVSSGKKVEPFASSRAGGLLQGKAEPFFDRRIVRETHMRSLRRSNTDLGAKKLSVVFDELQRRPSADLRGVVFMDDCLANVKLPASIGGEAVKAAALTALSVAPYEMKEMYIPLLEKGFWNLYDTLMKKMIGAEAFMDFSTQSIRSVIQEIVPAPGCWPRSQRPAYVQDDLGPLARRLKGHFMSL